MQRLAWASKGGAGGLLTPPNQGRSGKGRPPSHPWSSSTGCRFWSRRRADITIGITACSRLMPPPCCGDRLRRLPMAGPSAATEGCDCPAAQPRPRTGYLWAMLLARIYEIFPLSCPRCSPPSCRSRPFDRHRSTRLRKNCHLCVPPRPRGHRPGRTQTTSSRPNGRRPVATRPVRPGNIRCETALNVLSFNLASRNNYSYTNANVTKIWFHPAGRAEAPEESVCE
jgi:hypothetical protein